MGWTNTAATEITAPATVPFLPGFDVMGIGSELPAELQDSVVKTALVMYNSNWSPTNTVPTVKFHFLGTAEFTNGTGFVIGMGSCQNPSVNQTAIVALNLVMMYPNDNSSDVFFLMQDHSSAVGWELIMNTDGTTTETGLGGGGTLWQLPGNPGT